MSALSDPTDYIDHGGRAFIPGESLRSRRIRVSLIIQGYDLVRLRLAVAFARRFIEETRESLTKAVPRTGKA